MRIKNLNNQPYTLTTKTLTEVVQDSSILRYRMQLADLDPSNKGVQSVPYEILKWGGPQTFEAHVSISRGQSGHVRHIRIGCQVFEGANARAILKAAKAAQVKTKKSSKKSK